MNISVKRRIISLVCILVFCTNIFANADTFTEDKNRVIVNLEFDSMVTNAVPFGVVLSKAGAYVRQPDENVNNKVVEVIEPVGKSSLDVPINESVDSITFSFDYMQSDTQITRNISFLDTNSLVSTLVWIDTDGNISLADGKIVHKLLPRCWYNFRLVCRLSEKRYDLYINQSPVSSMVLMQNSTSIDGAKLLRFSAGIGGLGSKYYLDNIRCLKGTSLADDSIFTHEVFNEAWIEPVADSVAQDESSVYFNLNFNSDEAGNKPAGITLNTKSSANVFEVADFPDGDNKSLIISKGTGDSTDPYADISISNFSALSAVLEASLYPNDTSSNKLVTMKDANGKFNELMRFTNTGEITVCGKKVSDYTADNWYNISLIMNYGTMSVDAYINGEKKGEGIPFVNMNFEEPSTLRIQFPASSAAGSSYVDNIKFYAGSKIKTDEELSMLSQSDNTGNMLVMPEDEVEAMLSGAVAVQMYSNKAYANGKKQHLSAGAKKINDELYIPMRYVIEALGGEVIWSEQNSSITVKANNNIAVYKPDSSVMHLNGIETPLLNSVYIIDSVSMLAETELKKLFPDIYVYKNEKYGIVVFAKSDKAYSTKQLKSIYDYTTYSRPTANEILESFKSMQGVHPRLMATANDFDLISKNIKTDSNMAQWYDYMIKSADNLLDDEHTYYYIPDGVRLLEMSRQLLSRARILGMSYRLSGEQKYLDYLWGEIESVCSFKDWNAEVHFLDTAEMTAGVAIAYDWCYDAWSPSQRKVMEDAIFNLGLEQGKKCLDYKMPTGTQWQNADHNWNQVCNGGMTLGALALMDLYPEYCADIVSRSLLSLENSLGEYAPDGAWYEGPDYWAYALRYLVYHMSSLNTALGTDFGYLDGSYMRTTADYITYTQSSQGAFNIGDAANTIINEPAVFYLGKYFDMPELTKKRLQNMNNYDKSGSAVDLLFYESSHSEMDVNLSLDAKFKDVEIATFRSEWNDDNAMFVGIHGGYNDVNHGNLDAGTFILDAQGVRWADELGSDNYNQPNYFTRTGGARYRLYRCSTQGQNVLALNPVTELGQEQYATALITDYVSKPRGGYAVLDMTSVYGNKVTDAKRGIKLDHYRTQAVVQDEFTLTYTTDVWWFMHTGASIEIAQNGKSAILSKNGKKMYVVLDCSVKSAVFTSDSATPIEDSGITESSYSLANYRRLQIHIPKANGDVTLAVRFIPLSGEMMLNELIQNGAGKTVPLSRWAIDDGEIVKPELKTLTVNGTQVNEFSSDKTSYSVNLDFGNDAVPVIDATASEDFDVLIAQPHDANGIGEVKVCEKNNPDNATYYSIGFRVLPMMGIPQGYTQQTVKSVEVSSEPQSENPRYNAFDDNLATRWSADGYNEWIKLDLGEVKPMDSVSIAFYSGTKRVTYFDIQLSTDGKNWTTVYSGESSGLTDEYESYFVGAGKARYVRINCFGNSVNAWNSLSEIKIFSSDK